MSYIVQATKRLIITFLNDLLNARFKAFSIKIYMN